MKLKKQNGLYNLYNGSEIIASTQDGLPNLLKIDTNQVETLLGKVDIEKLVKEKMGLPNYLPINSMSPTMRGSYDFGVDCYKQALKDNTDKKFTLADIHRALGFGRNLGYNSALSLENGENLKLIEESDEEEVERFIQSITKQQTEWEVEVELQKLADRPTINKQGFINILSIK